MAFRTHSEAVVLTDERFRSSEVDLLKSIYFHRSDDLFTQPELKSKTQRLRHRVEALLKRYESLVGRLMGNFHRICDTSYCSYALPGRSTTHLGIQDSSDPCDADGGDGDDDDGNKGALRCPTHIFRRHPLQTDANLGRRLGTLEVCLIELSFHHSNSCHRRMASVEP